MSRDVELDVLAQRAGASSRTADELASVFVGDVVAIIAGLKDDNGAPVVAPHVVVPEDVQAAMDDADEHGWCEGELESDYSNSELLSDFIPTCESWLSDFDMVAIWDDGYNIYDASEWDDATWEEMTA